METETTTSQEAEAPFAALGLPENFLRTLDKLGYETPSPIQARTIPALLAGRDVLGQAQTGTGKTAAFALPLLARLDLDQHAPQVLVLTPTRELAIQVAEAFQRYAANVPGFRVLPIYGGQAYSLQLKPLQRGVHVVVGTPGRVMDHMRRGTLKLDGLKALVLDEADEMLRMGFLEDVTWILEQMPAVKQTALFSATMPVAVRKIHEKHLTDPEIVRIESRSRPADTIRQRVQRVHGPHKLEALARILEAEDYDGMIVFVRTKNAAAEVAEKLEARGLAAAALSGDVNQAMREKTVNRLKKGSLDILVATDVAARGLDVDRISHVVNYDIPYDAEAYVHRIGRTGRAGRTGEAILFVKPREQRMLRSLERAVGKPMEPMKLPSPDELSAKRVERFKAKVVESLQKDDQEFWRTLVGEMIDEDGTDALDLAAALARLAQGDAPLQVEKRPKHEGRPTFIEWTEGESNQGDSDRKKHKSDRFDRGPRQDRGDRYDRGSRDDRGPRDNERPFREKDPSRSNPPERGMERFRIEIGHDHDVRPGSIMGAICNEAGLEGRHIGRIEIYGNFSTVDLPAGMPREVFESLQEAKVMNRDLRLSKMREPAGGYADRPDRASTSDRGGPRHGGGGGGGGGFGGKPRHGGRPGGHHGKSNFGGGGGKSFGKPHGGPRGPRRDDD